MIEKLSNEGWEATRWHSFDQLIVYLNTCTQYKDSAYVYIVGEINGMHLVYRQPYLKIKTAGLDSTELFEQIDKLWKAVAEIQEGCNGKCNCHN